jgi:hypothetical protein
VCAGLTASRSAIGVRRIASSLACVMPIREDGTHGDKQQKSCANRNDQVDPKIPAVTFPRHEWLMLMWPTQGADDSSVRAGLVPLESPSIIGSPLARPPSSSSPDRWVVPSGRLTLGASRQCPRAPCRLPAAAPSSNAWTGADRSPTRREANTASSAVTRKLRPAAQRLLDGRVVAVLRSFEILRRAGPSSADPGTEQLWMNPPWGGIPCTT